MNFWTFGAHGTVNPHIHVQFCARMTVFCTGSEGEGQMWKELEAPSYRRGCLSRPQQRDHKLKNYGHTIRDQVGEAPAFCAPLQRPVNPTTIWGSQ